ncbi:MAG: hypothetical protein AAF542_05425 [Pseudomonadota bacterium]
MIEIETDNVQLELRSHCQKWLSFVATGDFDAAGKLIDAPNCYGINWGKKEIFEVVEDYFGEDVKINIHNRVLADCEPSYLERNDGGLLYDFNLFINDELTDLTVMFEFNPKRNRTFEVVIHDIHVL